VLIRSLNPAQRRFRWPLKVTFLGLVVLFTLYPNPVLLTRHVRHWSDIAAMIEPDEPALLPMLAEVNRRLACEPEAWNDPPRVLEVVQDVVCSQIDYAWDWENWGCVDYLPTVAETIRRGREDCDGRAVVAASILQRLGFESSLITDGSHVWVRTSAGETMSPVPTMSGRTLVTTNSAGESAFDPFALLGGHALLVDWPKNFAYGAAVFPVARLAIIVAAMLLCLFPPRPSVVRAAASLVAAAGALLTWRTLCSDPWNNSLAGAWAGMALSASSAALAWGGQRGFPTRRLPGCEEEIPEIPQRH
jgi:hypothetical protein